MLVDTRRPADSAAGSGGGVTTTPNLARVNYHVGVNGYDMREWDSAFEGLAAFKLRHGHTKVPGETLEDREQHAWLEAQRALAAQGKLPRQCSSRLHDLDPAWNSIASAEQDREQEEASVITIRETPTSPLMEVASMLVFADGKSAPAASRPPKSLVDKTSTSPTSQEVESDLVVVQGKGNESKSRGQGEGEAGAAAPQQLAGISIDTLGPAVLKGLGLRLHTGPGRGGPGPQTLSPKGDPQAPNTTASVDKSPSATLSQPPSSAGAHGGAKEDPAGQGASRGEPASGLGLSLPLMLPPISAPALPALTLTPWGPAAPTASPTQPPAPASSTTMGRPAALLGPGSVRSGSLSSASSRGSRRSAVTTATDASWLRHMGIAQVPRAARDDFSVAASEASAAGQDSQSETATHTTAQTAASVLEWRRTVGIDPSGGGMEAIDEDAAHAPAAVPPQAVSVNGKELGYHGPETSGKQALFEI